MAELEDTIAKAAHHKLPPGLGSPRPPPAQAAQHNTCRFLGNFVSKAAPFVVFAALLAFFPSQAPEFVNQTLLTQSWELLHLLLVGIAVSYGLFSRRNAEAAAADKEALHRAEATPRSYVLQLLQVPSVFDDGDEDGEARSGADGSKLRVWNSQYYRVEPTVVFAQGSSVNGGSSAGRPLLLPVRSLRSRIPDEESPGENGSRSFPKSGVENGQLGEVGSLDTPPPGEGLTGGAALASPAPWRSRSGRMEVREESSATALPSCSLPPSAMDGDMGTLRSPSFHSPSTSRSNSATSSPRRLSRSLSLSPELRVKTGEDSGKKKTFYKPPPPPPPPPPTPPFGHRPPHTSSERKDAKRSFKDELKDFDSKPRFPVEGYSPGRSVRTVRPTKESAPQGVRAARPSSPAATAASAPSLVYEYENEEEEEPKEKKDGLEDAVMVETEDDSDSDDAFEVGELPAPAAAEADENEVDKKADEFIAKFREQIRLQRIESIRRSAGQRDPGSTK